MVQKQKLNSIEALRFFFMLVICFWHCFQSNPVLAHGGIVVEWFFILSGMLLYGSYTRHKDEGTLDFTLRKYIRFAPEYLLVLVCIYLRHLVLPALVGRRAWDVDALLRVIPEALMLQNCGFYAGGMNHPLWYVCALLIGGAIIHSLLRNYREKATSLIIPLVVLLGYTYMFNEMMHGTPVQAVKGAIYINLLRGVCGIGLGALLAHAMSRKQELIAARHRMFNALSILALVLFIGMFFYTDFLYYPYSLIASSFMLLGCMMPTSLLNKTIFCNNFNWGGVRCTVLGIAHCSRPSKYSPL